MKKKEIEIDGTMYVPKDSQPKATEPKATELDGMKYCVVRTYSAGVFTGYIEKREGKEVVIRNARKLWYWDGAATLSELAVKGVSKPENCKFPCEVDKIKVLEAIEILYCTEEAKQSIASVEVWTEHK